MSGELKRLKVRYTNVFLLEGTQGWLMVDTGPETDIDYILNGLKGLGISPDDVKFVFLTHHHHDHAGNLAAVMRRLPDARLIVHEAEVDYISKGKMKMPRGRNLCLQIAVTLGRLLDFTYEPYTPGKNDILIDDEGLDLQPSGFEWRIIHTSGHTAGSISLVKGTKAIVGDIVMNRKDWCWSSPLPAFLESMDETLKSWRKLIELGVKEFLPSHGNPITVEKLEKYLS